MYCRAEEGKSFHGELISSVFKYWVSLNLFEKIESSLGNDLASILDKYLPSIITIVDLDITEESIDTRNFSGKVYFKKENGEDSVLNFEIINEHSKYNEGKN